jgi:hypothetical protein
MAADAFIKAHVECRRGSRMPAESLASHTEAGCKAHASWRMPMEMPRWPKRALATRVDILIRCSIARGIRPAESGQPEEIAIPPTVCLHRVMSARARSCIEHQRRYIELLFKKEKRTRGKENGT